MREDEDRFRAYCAAHGASLLRFGLALTGDRELAADLVQTALARTYAAWPRVVRRDAPDGYVRRTMVNTLANHRRRRPWREAPTASLPELAAEDAPRAAVDDRIVLLDALRTLPPRQRATVLLRYCEDRSEADVARLLGCSPGTVKSQAAKGLAKLRAALAPSEEVRR